MEGQYFTKEGLEKLKQELEHRMTDLRPEIAVRIKEAKELGDLSENAEYAEAKEAQGYNEGRIEEIKKILDKAVIFSGSAGKSVVGVGTTIKVKSAEGERKFTIVGAAESNPATGFISNESPIGSAFLGKKKGDTVEVKTPKGAVEYKIIEVQ